MGFSIVQGSPQAIWCPVKDSDTIYEGQLVQFNAADGGVEGVEPLGAAAGILDTTANTKIVFGVVIGTNLKTPSYDSTYQQNKITDATPHGSTTEFVGVEGPWSKFADHQAMVKVAIITPETVIRGPIRAGALGTGLTEATVTDGNSAGTSCSTDATIGDGNPTYTVKGFRTMYIRSGTNKGAYRVEDSNGSDDFKWDKPLYADLAAGDKLVCCRGLRPFGYSYMQLDSESMYIDTNANCSTNNYGVIVHRLDLSVANDEYVEFRFDPLHVSMGAR